MPIPTPLGKLFPRRETAPEKVCDELEANPEAVKERNDLVENIGPIAAVLGDQTRFTVSPEQFDRLQQLLNAPPNPNERLRRTMNAPKPWQT